MALTAYRRERAPAVLPRGTRGVYSDMMPFRERVLFAVDGRPFKNTAGRLPALRDPSAGAKRLDYPALGMSRSAIITLNNDKPTLDMRDAPAGAGGYQVPLEDLLRPDAVTLMFIFSRPQFTEPGIFRALFSVMKDGEPLPSLSLQGNQSAYRMTARREVTQVAEVTNRTFSNDTCHVVFARWSWKRSVATIWNPNGVDAPVDNAIAPSLIAPGAGIVDKPKWSEADGWKAVLFNRYLAASPTDQPNRFVGQCHFAMAVDWDWDKDDRTSADFIMFRDFCNAKRAEMIG